MWARLLNPDLMKRTRSGDSKAYVIAKLLGNQGSSPITDRFTCEAEWARLRPRGL